MKNAHSFEIRSLSCKEENDSYEYLYLLIIQIKFGQRRKSRLFLKFNSASVNQI